MKKLKLIFGTGNKNKVVELQERLPDYIELHDMESIGITTDFIENSGTIKGNAIQKLNQLTELYAGNCLTEDTGLCVPALGGAPGVHSARYAGPEKSEEKNIQKLLKEIQGKDRNAYFLTVIALYWDSDIYTFEGRCAGRILEEKTGTGGFGYDPIFQPIGYRKSFAELSTHEKGVISHRGKALNKLLDFIVKYNTP